MNSGMLTSTVFDVVARPWLIVPTWSFPSIPAEALVLGFGLG
jgi:hypothetical protein